jgi:transcriptional regulator with XRE-family HTH domain
MVKVNLIKGKMVEQNITQQALAHELGVDVSTLYRWFRDPETYITIRIARKILNVLGIPIESSLAKDIFFAPDVA